MDDVVIPPTEAWMDERLVIGPSTIDHHGLFFTEKIPADTQVVRLGGRFVTSTELDLLIRRTESDPTAPYVDTVTVFDDAHLVLPPGTPIHYGNHSCDPTLWVVGPFAIATRRDVTRGEEATIDYGTVSAAPGFRMACRCGAETCRGEVTSTDWQQVDLQQRYRSHWTPALRKRMQGH